MSFTIYLSSIEGGDVCRELHYLFPATDKALVGHVTKMVKVNNADQCEIRCYRELGCLSYNLGPYQGNGHVCELSNSDHLRHPDDLVITPGFIYGGTENSCSSSPCSNNATCLNLTPTTFQCLCPEGFFGKNCEVKQLKGKSCRDIKTRFPRAEDGMYQVQPDGGPNMFWVYCDMTSFSGGWTMCYSTDNLVRPQTEVTYDENLPYGTNGYRTDCNNIEFREILFVDETTGEKAFFTYKLSSPLTARGNYRAQLPGLWQGGGVADTSYEYQLLICDLHVYSGFFISKYTGCYKRCDHWCGDFSSPYFRSASTASHYAGVAFNANGHRPLSSRLISVGLR